MRRYIVDNKLVSFCFEAGMSQPVHMSDLWMFTWSPSYMSMHLYPHINIYIYIYILVCVKVCVFVYIINYHSMVWEFKYMNTYMPYYI